MKSIAKVNNFLSKNALLSLGLGICIAVTLSYFLGIWTIGISNPLGKTIYLGEGILIDNETGKIETRGVVIYPDLNRICLGQNAESCIDFNGTSTTLG